MMERNRKDIGSYIEARIRQGLEYVLCFLIIILETGMWLRFGYGARFRLILKALIPGLSLLLLGLRLIRSRKRIIPIQFIVWALVFALCLLISLFAEYPNLTTTLFLLVIILAFLFLAGCLEERERAALLRKYVHLMLVISAVSLFFYFFGSILHLVRSSGEVRYMWDWERRAVNFYHLYYAPTTQKADTLIRGLQRNCAIFTEGTMFSYYLTAAYMFESQDRRSRRWVRAVLLFALLTTLSTTGIIAVILFEGIRRVFSDSRSRVLFVIKTAVMPAAVLLAGMFVLRLTQTKMSTGSFGVRFDHIRGCFQAFASHLPLGLGYGGSDALKELYYYRQGTSVGIPSLLAYGGLGGAVLWLVPTVLYLYRALRKRDWNRAAFGVAFTWIFFFTNTVFTSVLQWLILSFVYVRGSYEMRSIPCHPRRN